MAHANEDRMSVAIIGGAGGIGSSLAFNLLQSDMIFDVTIVDTRENMITSHVMDLQDTLPIGAGSSVRGGTIADAAQADIVAISAAVPLRLNEDRSVFFADNLALVRTLLEQLRELDWNGILVLMTNPVDALITRLVPELGLNPNRVIGYTTNDSLRFRTGIAQALGVASRDVEALVIGEHGSGQVPLFSTVRVGGEPRALTDEHKRIVHDYIDNWYVRHVALDSGRTSTWSSGLGGALLIEAIRTGSEELVTGSVVLRGAYGVDSVSLGAPIQVGPEGVRAVVELALTTEELVKVRAGAERVREMSEQ